MKPLRVGDKVKVKEGYQQQSTHDGVATVKKIEDTKVSIVFDGSQSPAVYEETELVKQ